MCRWRALVWGAGLPCSHVARSVADVGLAAVLGGVARGLRFGAQRPACRREGGARVGGGLSGAWPGWWKGSEEGLGWFVQIGASASSSRPTAPDLVRAGCWCGTERARRRGRLECAGRAEADAAEGGQGQGQSKGARSRTVCPALWAGGAAS